MDKKQHWEQVYHEHATDQVSWFEPHPELSLKLIHQTGIAPSDAILDVGAGASTLVDHLLAEGFSNLSVLDISPQALQAAKQRLGPAATRVQWYEADVIEFTPPQRFTLWHDRAVFHFITDTGERKKYVEALNRSLAPRGNLIMATFALGGPLKCSGLDIVQYDACKLSGELGPGFQLRWQQTTQHQTSGGKLQKFSYFWFTKTNN